MTARAGAPRLVRSGWGLLLLLVLVCACQPQPTISGLGVADERELPQDPARYLCPPGPPAWSLDPARQRAMMEDFRQRFFAPWDQDGPSQDAQETRQDFLDFRGALGYGENRLPRDQSWLDGLLELAGLEDFPNAGYAAISLGVVDLRALPTARPLVEGFDHPGQGLAFDQIQQSLLAQSTPLYVAHASRDGAWLWCDTPIGPGWLRAEMVARAPGPLRAQWRGSRLAAVVQDDVSLRDGQGVFRGQAGLGAVLPLMALDGQGARVLMAVGVDGLAQTRPLRLAAGQAVEMPWPLTPAKLALLAGRLMGQAYGWGGSFGNRDCSSMVKDLFTPFGLWLPRNSGDQARQGGLFLGLGGLAPEEKERRILAEGPPGLTLVWRPGHIMLYLGRWRGQAVVLHNLWGLPTRDAGGREGRQVVGRAVVTTLRAGRELPNLARPGGLLLNRVEGMTLLVPPGQPPR